MKILLVTIILFIPGLSNSHGGGLDSYGCHNNRKEGGYHCHRGENKGKIYSSKSEMLGSAAETPKEDTKDSKKKN